MQTKKWICSGLLGVLLMGCSPATEKKGDNRIDIATAFEDIQPLKASDYFSQLRYVALETTDESVIGRGADITILGDKIVVMAVKQCLLFDKATGRYLTTVGHHGEDPEGYSNASGWVNPLTETIYLKSWKNSWCTYDINGNFLRKVNPPEGVSTGGSFVPLDKERMAVHIMDFFADGVESVKLFTEESVLHTSVLHEQDMNFNVNNIESISVMKMDNNREVYGNSGVGAMSIMFKDAPGKAYVSIMGLQRMWKLGNQAYLKTEHNDTIYRLNDNQLEPAYILELGKYHWPYEERFNMEYDQALMVTHIIDHPEQMIIRLAHRMYTDDKRKAYTVMYNKTSGDVRIGRVEEGIEDDLTHFMPLRPETISARGEYAALVQATEVIEWFEEHGSDKLAPEIEHLRKVEEEDNPVIVFMEK